MSMWWTRVAVVAALCLALGPASWAAPATPNTEQARVYFKAGAQAYDAGQYLAAIQAFQQAYQLDPREGLLFSMGQAYRRQYYVDKRPEHLQAAIQKYRAYVKRAPSGNRVGDAAEALSELEPLAAKLGEAAEGVEAPVPLPPLELKTHLAVSTEPKKASIEVDGKAVSTPVLEVKPGSHQVVVHAKGYFDETRDVPVPEGAMAAVHLKLRPKPAQLRVRTEDGAEVYVDGRPVGITPLSSALELTAGKHLIAVSKSGREGYSTDVEVGLGAERELTVELDGTVQRTASYVFFGTGIAAVVAGGVFTGIALHYQGTATDIEDEAAVGNIPGERLVEHNDAIDQRDSWRLGAAISFGGAALAGVTGLFLYAFDQPSLPRPTGAGPTEGEPEAEPEAPATMEVGIGPLALPAGGGVSLVGRF